MTGSLDRDCRCDRRVRVSDCHAGHRVNVNCVAVLHAPQLTATLCTAAIGRLRTRHSSPIAQAEQDSATHDYGHIRNRRRGGGRRKRIPVLPCTSTLVARRSNWHAQSRVLEPCLLHAVSCCRSGVSGARVFGGQTVHFPETARNSSAPRWQDASALQRNEMDPNSLIAVTEEVLCVSSHGAFWLVLSGRWRWRR